MPGLVAILSPAGRQSCEPDLRRMLDSLPADPAYQVGSYVNDELGVYVGWSQLPFPGKPPLPWKSRDGRWLVFFHGEHHAIVAAGERAADSAADPALRLFEEKGWAALNQLNGWFHGVAIDLHRKEAAVFNDRFGMQKLHLHQDGDTHLFASSVKALLAIRPQLRRIDPQSLGEFLTSACVLENRSLFAGVTTLPAASVRLFSGGVIQRKYQYFSAKEWESQTPMAEGEFLDQAEAALALAIDRCLGNSGNGLAVSLTGGYDTRLIMAHLRKAGRKLPSYTFVGPYRECFDVKIGRKVAEICGCPHQVFPLDGKFFQDFPSLAAKTVSISDGLLGATNAYEFYLNRSARAVAPARLTGSFGSEVMRGARAFKAVPLSPGLISADFQPHIDASIKTFARNTEGHAVSFSVYKHAPWLYYNRLAVEQSHVHIRTPYMDNDFVGLFYRRPASLDDGKELARKLITRYAPVLAELPTDTGNCSYFRRQWIQFLFKADYCYKSGMPQWLERVHYLLGPLQPEKLIIGTHRFAHFRIWFRKQLAPYVREILLDRRTAARPYFNHSYIEKIVHHHLKGDQNYTDQIERVLTVELACREFLDN